MRKTSGITWSWMSQRIFINPSRQLMYLQCQHSVNINPILQTHCQHSVRCQQCQHHVELSTSDVHTFNTMRTVTTNLNNMLHSQQPTPDVNTTHTFTHRQHHKLTTSQTIEQPAHKSQPHRTGMLPSSKTYTRNLVTYTNNRTGCT
jgi:hypothetical protein